jgi:maleate cis-trans isomerase
MVYGWRGKIGHVCPAIYDTGAYEFEQLLPDGVITVTVTLNVQQLVVSEFERAAALMIDAAKKLADEDADVVITGGDPLIAMNGVGADQRVIAQIRELTGKPASTSLTTAMDGLRALGAKRIAVASPYTEERNLVTKTFLEANGFDVPVVKSLGIVKNVDLTRLPFHASYRLALEAFRAAEGIEGIYLPCGRWPVVGNLRAIEDDTGACAVSSIQSMAWFGLKELGIGETINGYGRLLESLSEK